MSQEKVFEVLGLTKNETRVFSTLVRFGKMGSGALSQESGVPYSRVYDVLGSLVEKGLVEVVPEKSKQFVPADPDVLTRLIEQKEKGLSLAKEKVKELKQFYEVKEKQPVVMGMGKKAFYELVREMKEAKKFDYAVKWTCEYCGEWAEDARKWLKKKRDGKTLTRYDGETKKDVDRWLKIHKNFRKFENDGVALAVTEHEVMVGLVKSNVTLLIRDKAFVDVMRRMFLATYDQAEKIG